MQWETFDDRWSVARDISVHVTTFHHKPDSNYIISIARYHLYAGKPTRTACKYCTPHVRRFNIIRVNTGRALNYVNTNIYGEQQLVQRNVGNTFMINRVSRVPPFGFKSTGRTGAVQRDMDALFRRGQPRDKPTWKPRGMIRTCHRSRVKGSIK